MDNKRQCGGVVVNIHPQRFVDLNAPTKVLYIELKFANYIKRVRCLGCREFLSSGMPVTILYVFR